MRIVHAFIFIYKIYSFSSHAHIYRFLKRQFEGDEKKELENKLYAMAQEIIARFAFIHVFIYKRD